MLRLDGTKEKKEGETYEGMTFSSFGCQNKKGGEQKGKN